MHISNLQNDTFLQIIFYAQNVLWHVIKHSALEFSSLYIIKITAVRSDNSQPIYIHARLPLWSDSRISCNVRPKMFSFASGCKCHAVSGYGKLWWILRLANVKGRNVGVSVRVDITSASLALASARRFCFSRSWEDASSSLCFLGSTTR